MADQENTQPTQREGLCGPTIVAYLLVRPDGSLSMDAVRHKPKQPAVAVMAVDEHAASVARWAEMFNRAIEGHGHVFPRADGVKMRCGGPGLCPKCTADASLVHPCPAHPAVGQAARDERKLSDLGNELHNLSCSLIHENEEWAEQIGGIARELWNWPQARAALAEVAGLRSLLNSLLCYVERDINRMRSDRDKSDNKEIYDRSISLAMERLKAAQNAVFTTEPGCDTAVELAAQTTQAQHSVPEEFSFEYRHPNGESHTVTVSRDQVINEMPDFLFEALCSKLCNCEPAGETNVVECCCDEYAEEFKLLAAAPVCRLSRNALTDAQMRRLYENSTETENERLGFAAFARLIRRAEAVHQIAAAPGNSAQHSVPEGWKLVPVEPLLNMMSDKDHDTRITAERQLLSILADAPAQAQHSAPEVSGIGRDTGHPRAVVLYLRKEPTDDDLRAIHDALRSLAAAPGKEVPQAWLDVQAERRRQITAEGWTPEHDDLYCAAELPRAAAAYILNGANDEAPAIWPFSAKWWKPRDARANYVRAAALILAEIERLDRAAPGKDVGHE